MATETESVTASSEAHRNHSPAYTTVTTLTNFLESLKDTGLPGRIDKSLVPTMSGGTQSALLAALKFLNLTDNNGTVESSLKELVDSTGTPEFGATFKGILDTAYEPLLGDIDLNRITPAQLKEKFAAAGITATTSSKAIRFYLRALNACGVETPKRLENVSNPKPANRKRKPAAAKTKEQTPEVNNPPKTPERKDDTPADMIDFKVPFGHQDGMIRVPRDITEAQLPVLKAIVMAVEALAAQNEND